MTEAMYDLIYIITSVTQIATMIVIMITLYWYIKHINKGER